MENKHIEVNLVGFEILLCFKFYLAFPSEPSSSTHSEKLFIYLLSVQSCFLYDLRDNIRTFLSKHCFVACLNFEFLVVS